MDSRLAERAARDNRSREVGFQDMLYEVGDSVGKGLTWEVGGRHGVYKGKLEVENGCYVLRGDGMSYPNLGSTDPEKNKFLQTHVVNVCGQIVQRMAA